MRQTCEERRERVGRYLLDAMTEPERNAFEQELCAADDLARELARQSCEHAALRDVLVTLREYEDAQIAARGSLWSRFRFVPRLAAAAAALVVVAAVWWMAGSSPTLRSAGGKRPAANADVVAKVVGKMAGVRCSASAPRATGDKQVSERVWTELQVGDAVRAGTRIETGQDDAVTLAWVGHPASPESHAEARPTTLQLGGNSTLDTRHSTLAFLERGRLIATVAKQEAGKPFVIETPQARVTVVGTRFSLTVAGDTGEAIAPAHPSSLSHQPVFGTQLEVQDGVVRMMRLEDGAEVDVPAGQGAVAAQGIDLKPQPLEKNTESGLKIPTPPGRIILKFDFEDGQTGPEWVGQMVQGPPRSSNRYCMEVTAADGGIRWVILRNKANGLFTYRPGMVLSFDYWAGEDVSAIDVYLWDRTQKASLGCEPIYKPARGRWTHVRRDLREFYSRDDLRRLQDGSLLKDLTIKTGGGRGGQLFVDNVSIETTDVGRSPGR